MEHIFNPHAGATATLFREPLALNAVLSRAPGQRGVRPLQIDLLLQSQRTLGNRVVGRTIQHQRLQTSRAPRVQTGASQSGAPSPIHRDFNPVDWASDLLRRVTGDAESDQAQVQGEAQSNASDLENQNTARSNDLQAESTAQGNSLQDESTQQGRGLTQQAEAQGADLQNQGSAEGQQVAGESSSHTYKTEVVACGRQRPRPSPERHSRASLSNSKTNLPAKKQLKPLQDRYDAETRHGVVEEKQAEWETRISKGFINPSHVGRAGESGAQGSGGISVSSAKYSS